MWLVASGKEGFVYVYKNLENKYWRLQVLSSHNKQYSDAKISKDYSVRKVILKVIEGMRDARKLFRLFKSINEYHKMQ